MTDVTIIYRTRDIILYGSYKDIPSFFFLFGNFILEIRYKCPFTFRTHNLNYPIDHRNHDSFRKDNRIIF